MPYILFFRLLLHIFLYLSLANLLLVSVLLEKPYFKHTRMQWNIVLICDRMCLQQSVYICSMQHQHQQSVQSLLYDSSVLFFDRCISLHFLLISVIVFSIFSSSLFVYLLLFSVLDALLHSLQHMHFCPFLLLVLLVMFSF